MAMTYSLNFAVNKESPYGRATKQNNQFLSVVDLYSLDPTNLKVVISSANFGEGNYPDLAKHRWIIRTHDSFLIKISFETVDIEVDIDTIDVYKLHDVGDKELVDQITVAKQILVESNQAEIVFRTDCTVNKYGFRATLQIIKNKNQAKKTQTKSNSNTTRTTRTTTTEIPTTQNITTEISTTHNTIPETPTTENIIPKISSAQNITSEIPSTHNTIPEVPTTHNTITETPTTQNTTTGQTQEGL